MGLTARSASWARRMLRLEREVRRLGACIAGYSFRLAMICAASGALEFERSQNRQARVARLMFATALVKVEIGPALRAQPLAVLAAERAAREREDELLGDQRSKIDLIAVIERKFQVLRAQPPLVVVGRRARRQYETKRTCVGLAELLRAARARRDHRRTQPTFEEQLHTGPVV